MRRLFGYIFLMILGVFLLMQFMMRPAQINEPVTEDDIVEYLQINADVAGMLKTACYDCHSNQPKYPWYANVAPFSWNIASHIYVGRSALNFSEWSTYTSDDQDTRLKEIIEQVEERQMPLPSYLRMHAEARAVLTPERIEKLRTWVLSEREKIKTDTSSTPLQTDNQ